MANRISVNKPSSTAPSTRGKETREALMRAVEQLAAEKGLAYISIREILSKANQKNESLIPFGRAALLRSSMKEPISWLDCSLALINPASDSFAP
jgi:hypothetical protein